MRKPRERWSSFRQTSATRFLILIAASAQTPIDHQAIPLGHTVHMPDQRTLTLQHADQARTEFAPLCCADQQRAHCQLTRLWYARRVGGAAARVGELLYVPIMLPR